LRHLATAVEIVAHRPSWAADAQALQFARVLARSHREYFARECAKAKREFSESMLVVCERFEVVHRP